MLSISICYNFCSSLTSFPVEAASCCRYSGHKQNVTRMQDLFLPKSYWIRASICSKPINYWTFVRYRTLKGSLPDASSIVSLLWAPNVIRTSKIFFSP